MGVWSVGQKELREEKPWPWRYMTSTGHHYFKQEAP